MKCSMNFCKHEAECGMMITVPFHVPGNRTAVKWAHLEYPWAMCRGCVNGGSAANIFKYIPALKSLAIKTMNDPALIPDFAHGVLEATPLEGVEDEPDSHISGLN